MLNLFAMEPTPDIRIPAVPRIAESNPSVVSYLVGNPAGIRTTYHPSVHRGMAADHTVASKEEWLNITIDYNFYLQLSFSWVNSILNIHVYTNLQNYLRVVHQVLRKSLNYWNCSVDHSTPFPMNI